MPSICTDGQIYAFKASPLAKSDKVNLQGRLPNNNFDLMKGMPAKGDSNIVDKI